MGYEVSFKSRIKGPISDGRIHQHVAEYEEEVAEALADEAESLVLTNLMTSIRNPTPDYWTRIRTRKLSSNRYLVHDGGVVYGPWLEGTGSRNSPVTIFPGYASFERAEAELKRVRRNISRNILREHRSRGRLT
jgi:hypothetical protein